LQAERGKIVKEHVMSISLVKDGTGYFIQTRTAQKRVCEIEVNDLVSGMLTMGEVCKKAAQDHIVYLLEHRPDLLPDECREAILKEFPGIKLGGKARNK
jgi:hypothetical protein